MSLAIEDQEMVELPADLLRKIGSVPSERIAAYPAPGIATEADIFTQPDGEERLYELVDSVLVEKAVGWYESLLAGVLVQLLRNFLDEHPLGIVLLPDATICILPGQVRMPDVSFLSWDHFPGRKLPRNPILGRVPNLAVEIISEGNSQAEMRRKLHEYFTAGVHLVWYVYPETKTVDVYTSMTSYTTLGVGDILEGGAILPGFFLPVREWFERAGELEEES